MRNWFHAPFEGKTKCCPNRGLCVPVQGGHDSNGEDRGGEFGGGKIKTETWFIWGE